jgi:toxin HigB-1
MIVSITHKGLRLFWEKDDASKLPAGQVERIRRILVALDTMKTLEPLRQTPGYHLHALKGDLKDYWAVRVTGNYRIIFHFNGREVSDVDYMDYH